MMHVTQLKMNETKNGDKYWKGSWSSVCLFFFLKGQRGRIKGMCSIKGRKRKNQVMGFVIAEEEELVPGSKYRKKESR